MEITTDPTESNIGAVRVIIVAAGRSSRMSNNDKILADLNGLPLIVHSVDVFEKCELVDSILIVASDLNITEINEIALQMKWNKVTQIIPGGQRRQDSVLNGLEVLEECDWVIVHDGARPFVTIDMIKRGITLAQSEGSAVAAFPAVDTTKIIDGNGFVSSTLQRENLYHTQTPQIFKQNLLLNAHYRIADDVTDDASMVERLGLRVRIFEGSRWNFKITSDDDLVAANAIAKGKYL